MSSNKACSLVDLDIAVLPTSGAPLCLPVNRTRLCEAVEHLLKDLTEHPVEVSFCFCDDETIRRYNADYRHVDEPTDVLSFPLQVLRVQDSEFGTRERPERGAENGVEGKKKQLAIRNNGSNPNPESRTWSSERRIPLGDVMISIDTAKHQSQRNGLPLETEVLMLALHGVLHLMGYEDETDKGRNRMNRIATHTLQALGYLIEEDWYSYHYDERTG